MKSPLLVLHAYIGSKTKMHNDNVLFYRPRSSGDNAFGSVRLFVCLCVCLFVRALLFELFELW